MDLITFLKNSPLESKKENIVLRAWEFVTQFPSLKKFNFIPSFFGMTWLLLLLAYQVIFTLVILFEKKDEAVNIIYNFIHDSYIVEAVLFVGFIFVFYTLTNPIAKGGIIHMMDTYRKNEGKQFHRSWQ